MNQQTHIVFPGTLVHQIDSIVGKRARSAFLVGAAERELKRLGQLRAPQEATGSWKTLDHPELRKGSAAWVRRLRDPLSPSVIFGPNNHPQSQTLGNNGLWASTLQASRRPH